MVAASRFARLDDIGLAVVMENFLEMLAGATHLALQHTLPHSFAGDLAIHIMLELAERLGKCIALGCVVVIAPDNRGDALVECGSGLGDRVAAHHAHPTGFT